MNAQTQPTAVAETTLPAIPQRKPAEIRVVSDPIAVLDTARFEHMQRIANVMAASNLIPDGLCMTGSGEDRALLPVSQITANCFLVVNQAVRWGMDPFAVAQCVSVVHGKLCYEGKLIAAVLEARLGASLEYEITGQGDGMKVVVSAAIDGRPVVDSKGKPKTVEGTVADWKTTGNGSPWAARGGLPRMLRYRGAREWSRTHAPGLMLGVYSDDEMTGLSDEVRANRTRDITPERPRPPNPNAAPSAPAPAAESPATTPGPKPPNPNAPKAADPDVARVEAGRDDDQHVMWGETEADGIPRDLMRNMDMLKEALLGEIRKLNTKADLDHIANDKGFYEQKAKLPEADQTEVDIAFMRRSNEIRFPKKT